MNIKNHFPLIMIYTWKHLPTGMKGVETQGIRSADEARFLVKRWNCPFYANAGMKLWQYKLIAVQGNN